MFFFMIWFVLVSPSPPRRYPLTILNGNGCWLTTTDGKQYLDCVSGIATCALGHSNPALNAAIANQMTKVHHVSNLYYIPEQAALANWLCANSNAEKVFFCNSGAEANEAAIKVARRHAYNRGIEVGTRKRKKEKKKPRKTHPQIIKRFGICKISVL